MTTSDTEVLSALLDGEPLDADRLAAALEDPTARATLVDFVRLRAAVATDNQPVPPSLARLRSPRATGALLRWPAAAAVLFAVFLAGWFAPRPWNADVPVTPSDAPPQPTRIEKFVPGVDWHQSN